MLTQVGKYQILEKIGVGGFGSVYRGRDPFIKRSVAIKTCQGDDDEIRKRFFREAEYAGNLHHPNITTIYDFGVTEEGVPYIVQEFLTGEDLDKKIKRQEPIPLVEKLRILRDVAEGLGYAHNSGIVHRDIKPSNIRILDDGSVKIMDFGIAKSMVSESTLTQTGITLGTASYLAPEQIRGEPVDQRTDIFSLGVLAYELLTLQKPFTGDHISTVLYKILHENPVPPSEAAPGIPPALASVLVAMLEKDRAKRQASCAEIREQLYRINREIPGGSDRDGFSRTERLDVDPASAYAPLPAPPAPVPAPSPAGGSLSGSSDAAIRTAAAVSAGREVSLVGEIPLRKDSTESHAHLFPPPVSPGSPLRIFVASLVFLALVVAGGFYFWRPGKEAASAKPEELPSGTVPTPGVASPSPAPAVLPTAIPEPTATAVPVIATPVAAPAKEPPAASGFAMLRPNVYADLTLDGKKRGGVKPEGIRVGPLSPGWHKAVFACPNFLTLEREFEVRNGVTAEVRVEFPPRGQLKVNVNAEAHGAQVFVDGAGAGPAPLKKNVVAGTHRVEVRHPDFETAAQEVAVPEDEIVTATFDLKRRDSPPSKAPN